MEMLLSVNASATVVKPIAFRLLMGLSLHAHGMRNTDPIETRMARRLSGSHESVESTMPSIPRAEAALKMEPMLVASTTP